MKFHKIIPYKLKRLIPMAMIAGATTMPVSCCKCEMNQEPDPEPTRDIEIVFDDDTAGKILTFETLQNCANDKTVKTIYLVPTGHWDGNVAYNITYFRNKFLQPRLDISPKIRGRGDFDFRLGEASKVPDDSLWYVQQGWTINKKYQR